MGGNARSDGLRKGLEILCLFQEGPPAERGITRIAKEMGLHKSRVHRAVKTLEDLGFLRQNPVNHMYSLGFRAFELGVSVRQQLGLVPLIRPVCQDLSARLGGTVSLRILDGASLVVVDSVETGGSLRVHTPKGSRRPWNFGASGKLLAAFSPPDLVDHLIRMGGLPAFTERSISSVGDFHREMERIRERGYAVSDEEAIRGTVGIAAPVRAPGGDVLAALSAHFPSVDLRFNEQDPRSNEGRGRVPEFGKTLIEAAEEISRLMAIPRGKRADAEGDGEGRKSLPRGAGT